MHGNALVFRFPLIKKHAWADMGLSLVFASFDVTLLL